ncbi:MAG: UDP-glucose/GDP-mannose dehydrogenase family protein [Vampirovibrionales bacterium]
MPHRPSKKMVVIGSGYVGTVTGACLAELGHTVVCADLDEDKIARLQQGDVPFFEKGLANLIRTHQQDNRLSFTTQCREALHDADIIFLCVGPVASPVGGKPDMRPLLIAMDDIAATMRPDHYRLIVEKSTLPVQSGEHLTQMLTKALERLQPNATHDLLDNRPFDVTAVPQFMREGNAIHDFFNPDRIVIGSDNERATDILVKVYTSLNAPLLITDVNSAEVIKHATNAFLAMKISFINSIAHVCEKTNADVTLVAKGLGMDKRIAPDYLNAGIGYGGIFFPKDIHSLVSIADEYHLNLDLLKTTETINRYQRIHFIEQVEQAVRHSTGSYSLEGKTIAVWGLAFRPDTDDMRDCPSTHIIRGLMHRGAKIRAFDPIAMAKAKGVFPKITYCADVYEAAEGADAIAVLTEWPEFVYADFQRLKEVSRCRVIVDGRNLYHPQKMAELGYMYVSTGRKTAYPKHVVESDAPTAMVAQ